MLKIIVNVLRGVALACLFHGVSGFAATLDEVNGLLATMQVEKVLKTAISQVNNYQLQKRLKSLPSGTTEQKTESLKEFSALVEKHLDWKVIGPSVAQGFADELTTEEAGKLDAFFKSPAGRHYVEEYQYAAAPIAIALDAFVDTLVDDVMDTPDKPLELIKSIDANEAVASRLVAKMMSKTDQDNFAAAREQLLARMSEFTKPKATDQKAMSQHKKKMVELGKVYSLEQINWRTARVVNQKMAPDHVKQLLVAIDDANVAGVLQKLNSASRKVNDTISARMMGSSEFRSLMGRMLSGAK